MSVEKYFKLLYICIQYHISKKIMHIMHHISEIPFVSVHRWEVLGKKLAKNGKVIWRYDIWFFSKATNMEERMFLDVLLHDL